MANFSDISEFAADNDIEGFESFLEKVFLKASFPALLSVKEALLKGKSDFYTEAVFSWLSTIRSYAENSPSQKGAVAFVQAVFLGITEFDLPIEDIIATGEDSFDIFNELLRRMLFSFLRNTPPGDKRVRPRRALIYMGFTTANDYEDAFTPSVWQLYEESLKYELSGDDSGIKKSLKKIGSDLAPQDEEAVAGMLDYICEPAIKVINNVLGTQSDKIGSKSENLLARFEFKRRQPPELEVFYLDSPVPVEIEEKAEIDRPPSPGERIKELLDLIDEGAEIPSDTLSYLVSVVRYGNPEEYDQLNAYLQENGEHFSIRDSLRRELKLLMADGDTEPQASDRIFEILSYLGSATVSSRTILTSLNEIDDDEDDDEAASISIFPNKPLSIEEDLINPFPETIKKFLSSEASFHKLIEIAGNILNKEKDILSDFTQIFNFHLLYSGRILFEKLAAASKSFLEYARLNPDKAGQSVESAKATLFYLLCYNDCPDLVRMESFELLQRSGYLDFQTAEPIKKYGIAFVKDTLLRSSRGAACRALADLISLRQTSSSRTPLLEKKSFNKLLEEFVSLVFKEAKLKEKAYDLLNHVTYEDPLRLRVLSSKIQPVNYKEAIEAVVELVKRRNKWASLILVEAVGEEYTDIRDAAVIALGMTGDYLSPELKGRAAQLILDKAEECYDEEMSDTYYKTATEIAPEESANFLMKKWMEAGFNDRKQYGRLLLVCFESMSPSIFMTFFENDTKLDIIHNFIKKAQKDSFITEFASRFIEIYREKFIGFQGEQEWEELFTEMEKSRFVTMINEIWSLRFS